VETALLENSELKEEESPKKLVDEAAVSGSNVSLEPCSAATLMSWDDFKTEFDEVFREAEDKVVSGEINAMFPPSPPALGSEDTRNDLIIEMITSLHDSRADIVPAINHTPLTMDGALSQVHTQNSPNRQRRQLLSLTNLETIHEAELDRMLENMDDVSTPRRSRGCTDSGFYSLTDSDTTSPSSLQPKRVWGLPEDSTSDEGLMKQLHQLSLAHQSFGETQGVVGQQGKTHPSHSQIHSKDASAQNHDHDVTHDSGKKLVCEYIYLATTVLEWVLSNSRIGKVSFCH
jgi:hypothetical protein